MTATYIDPALIPGWPTPIAGAREQLDAALQAAGFPATVMAPEGLWVGDTTTATNFLSTYVGSSTQLTWNKLRLQVQLDELFDNHFDLAKFIRDGTATSITAANVGTFLATITNNYRSLRASIAAATSLAQLQAVNINSGWPSNP